MSFKITFENAHYNTDVDINIATFELAKKKAQELSSKFSYDEDIPLIEENENMRLSYEIVKDENYYKSYPVQFSSKDVDNVAEIAFVTDYVKIINELNVKLKNKIVDNQKVRDWIDDELGDWTGSIDTFEIEHPAHETKSGHTELVDLSDFIKQRFIRLG